MNLSTPQCSSGQNPEQAILIVWETREDNSLKGYLVGHPETTLFVIEFQNGDTCRLLGAFIPDVEEYETWDEKNAKAAAEKYMLDWIEMAQGVIAAQSPDTNFDPYEKPIADSPPC